MTSARLSARHVNKLTRTLAFKFARKGLYNYIGIPRPSGLAGLKWIALFLAGFRPFALFYVKYEGVPQSKTFAAIALPYIKEGII